MKYMQKLFFSVVLVLACGPLAAENDDNFYVGVGAAFLRIDTDLSSNGMMPTEPISGSDRFHKTSIASKLFAGYRIGRFAGIEVGYFKAFDVEQNYCFIDAEGGCTEERGTDIRSVVSSSDWTVEMPTSGYTLAATGFWPINDMFELMLKVGGVNSDVDGKGYEKIVGDVVPLKPPAVGDTPPAGTDPQPLNPPINTNISDSDWDAMGAIGVNFKTDGGISVRAELEYLGIKQLDEPWLISLNALYSF